MRSGPDRATRGWVPGEAAFRAWPRVGAVLSAALAAGLLAGCAPDAEGGSGDALGDVTPPLAAVPVAAEPPEPWAGSPEDREAVLGVVQGVLRAINEADPVLMQGLLTDGATVTRVFRGGSREAGGDGSAVSTIDRAAFIQGTSDPEQGFLERIWDPRIRIHGDLATVWAPYDFYLGGEFSHCGVDTFQMVRTPRGWRVHGLVYTVARPPACERHPGGAPPA